VSNKQKSFLAFRKAGIAVDPIHVGTGGARLGRVDNTIVRDPVTRLPKIPGSSLAGVHRSYAAMAFEDERTEADARHFYPDDAGQGTPTNDGRGPVNAVFGHRNFVGLAAFSDAQILLFPVASREGPVWVTSPGALRQIGASAVVEDDKKDKAQRPGQKRSVNLGWLQLDTESWSGLQKVKAQLGAFGISAEIYEQLTIIEHMLLVSDKLFSHIVNSNLEVRTSVAINPATGAAEDGALFTYEAIPRGTVFTWDVTCKNPRHFTKDRSSEVTTSEDVHKVVAKAYPLLEALGIGGMGTRGMGRLKVLASSEQGANS
jgi:CRISPR-associated protein Cmr4